MNYWNKNKGGAFGAKKRRDNWNQSLKTKTGTTKTKRKAGAMLDTCTI